ncbi:MAG: mycofactocin biosynthesis peptidyl-dipeptidase MftE [Acidimicrobiia bacterium]
MSGGLAERTWPEVSAAGEALLVVPLGSTEQHGPHLPLATDTLVAVALAEGLARRRSDVVAGPALPYGASGEHAAFPGTLSIGQEALEQVLVELGRSADHFAGVVFVSGHGGNAAPLARAVALLVAEGRRALAWSPRVAGGDAHAGRTETSLLLALHPDLVHEDDAAPGATEPLDELLPTLRHGGVRAVSANGVLGDPTGASAAEGARLLDALVAELCAAIDDWRGTLAR